MLSGKLGLKYEDTAYPPTYTPHTHKGRVIRSNARHVAARVWAEGLKYDHKGHRELWGGGE